jgi:D-alanyl-D-alanine carboxypeptidase
MPGRFGVSQRRCAAAVATILFVTGTASAQTSSRLNPAALRSFAAQGEAIVRKALASDTTIPGITVHVEVPRLGISWSFAAGVTDRESRKPLTTDHPFRIASVTKSYVAASIWRLIEQGRLSLDQPIRPLISPELRQLLENGGYDVDGITIRHLLTHTSGIFDYAMDSAYSKRIQADPGHRWTRLEQTQLAITVGQPYGKPGEVFHYSDTGYNLLGNILERQTGLPMGAAIRQLTRYSTRLGLTHTWLESVDPTPAGTPARAHQYIGDLDTNVMDPSVDLYGGGGIATTARELALFFQALFDGRVFDRAVTLGLMMTPPAVPSELNYRHGIYAHTTSGYLGWGHSGYWNVLAFHYPELDATVASSVNQRLTRVHGPLHQELVDLVARTEGKTGETGR